MSYQSLLIIFISSYTAPKAPDYLASRTFLPKLAISSRQNFFSRFWTTHFTTFVAYAETAISSGGGGGAVSHAPTVQIEVASTVTADSTVLNGDITDYGFLWGTSSSSLTNTLDVGADNHSGSFTATLSSLTAGTPYYFRAYATNSSGMANGAVMSFTTAAAPQASTTTPTTPTFSDIPSYYWAYDAINKLSSLGYITGYPDGTFRPNDHITGAEFVSILEKR